MAEEVQRPSRTYGRRVRNCAGSLDGHTIASKQHELLICRRHSTPEPIAAERMFLIPTPDAEGIDKTKELLSSAYGKPVSDEEAAAILGSVMRFLYLTRYISEQQHNLQAGFTQPEALIRTECSNTPSTPASHTTTTRSPRSRSETRSRFGVTSRASTATR